MREGTAFDIPDYSAITFEKPWVFLFLIFIPLLVFWYVKRHKTLKPDLKLSRISGLLNVRKSIVVRLIHLPFILRCLALALIIAALAQPQTRLSTQDMRTKGIDIMLAMDLSPSMLAKDFKPNRLESAKSVAMDFIDSRPSDRIGLVVFSGEAYTQCPLTIDHSVLKTLLRNVEPNFLADGTAIGMGLATAVNRLRESKALGKVIILITDGENNVGAISPLTAAEIAREYGIRVYTVGVGSRGMAYSPVTKMNGEFVFGYTEVKIDEALLDKMAEMTNGHYFRATNHEGLKEVYRQIDLLEKTHFDVTEYRRKKEEFWPLALLAALLLALEWLLRNTLMRSIP